MAVAYLSELVFVASVALLGRRARHLTSLPALNGVSGVLTGIVYEQRKDDVLNEERMSLDRGQLLLGTRRNSRVPFSALRSAVLLTARALRDS